MRNNIPTVYISEIYCCIVKSTNLSTIFQFCTKNMEKLKIKDYRVVMSTLEREPAFSVGHFRILHVNLMFAENIGEGLLHACISSSIIYRCQSTLLPWGPTNIFK